MTAPTPCPVGADSDDPTAGVVLCRPHPPGSVHGGESVGSRRSPARRRPLIVAGAPRSGTTWTKQVLDQDQAMVSLMEPDSEDYRAAAIRAKREVGRFPVLRPGAWDEQYYRLWSWILLGAPETIRQHLASEVLQRTRPSQRTRYLRGSASLWMSLAGTLADLPVDRRNPALYDRGLLVKTVHAPLALEWVAMEFDVDVLVVLRHPGSILASWLEVQSNERSVPFATDRRVLRLTSSWGLRTPGTDPLERTIWQIGVLVTALRDAASRHPEWTVRNHEALCRHPVDEFRQLYGTLGMTWTEDVPAFLRSRDRPGTGYVTKRVASTLPGNWRTRLTPFEQSELHRVLSWFPTDVGLGDDPG